MKRKVYYDGKCGLCSREIKYYMRIDKNKAIDWVDVNENLCGLNERGISLAQALLHLHAEDEEGELRVGVDAFIVIWRCLPRWKWLATFVAIPLVKFPLSIVYKGFARWRFNRLTHCQVSSQ